MYTTKQIDSACLKLAQINKLIAIDLELQFYPSPDAPNNFEELKKYSYKILNGLSFPVFSGGSSSAIYGKYDNYVFRAVHDYSHIKTNSSFSKFGECKAIDFHLKELKSYGASQLVQNLFLVDTVGQVKHYYQFKEFVSNQREFVYKNLCNQSALISIKLFFNQYK